MKKAEQMAWTAMGVLLGAAVLLLVMAWMYHVSVFWAAAMLCGGQGVVMGLAGYGLSLARQAAELRVEGGDRGGRQGAPAGGQSAGFRMSAGAESLVEESPVEGATVLDTTFQRILVVISGFLLLVFSGLTYWIVLSVYRWSQANPNLKVPITGLLENVDKPKAWIPFDEYALLAGLTAGAGYVLFYFLTRTNRQTRVFGLAAASNFSLGVSGMAGLAIVSVLAYFKVVWASEIGAAVIGLLMLLQGLELFVNAFRSYSSIEELDQDAVDLQATPLTPMLPSVWLGGLRMLAAQSLGLTQGGKKGEPSVLARMMPRALAAMVILAIVMSCFRVVPAGKVAVLERLGYTALDAKGRPLPAWIYGATFDGEGKQVKDTPGLYMTLPWPIDKLVYIPTGQLQTVEMGKELHAPPEWKNIDFQFWMVRPPSKNALADEAKDLFITGDPGSPQVLETFVEVRWRVADPARFYSAMSHSEYFQQVEGEGGGGATAELPIYEALVQQATSYAVTKTFAIHTMEQILVSARSEAEEHCREILQEKLDSLCLLPGEDATTPHRAIEVAYLTIKDLHPPYGGPDRPNSRAPVVGGDLVRVQNRYELRPNQMYSQYDRGPASAFELVVSMREMHDGYINKANGDAVAEQNIAHGDAVRMVLDAEADASKRIAQAHGDADRFVEMTKGMTAEDLKLMKLRLLYASVKDLLDPVTKVVVDPKVSDLVIIQNSDKSSGVGTLAVPQ